MKEITPVGGVYPLSIQLYPGNPFVHHILIKEHKGEAAGTSPVLFVSGLPPCMDEQVLGHAMSAFGRVLQTVLHPSKRSGMVVFEGAASVNKAIWTAQAAKVVDTRQFVAAHDGSGQDGTSTSEPTGLRAWVLAHKANWPGNEQLQAELDAWTDAHEAEVARKEREKQEAMGGDGWTVVVRSKGRKKTKDAGGITVQSGGMAAAAAAAAAASKQATPLEDFYRFQRREKRRGELEDLRQKFLQDRKRVAELRASRNFKPFS